MIFLFALSFERVHLVLGALFCLFSCLVADLVLLSFILYPVFCRLNTLGVFLAVLYLLFILLLAICFSLFLVLLFLDGLGRERVLCDGILYGACQRYPQV